MNPLQPIVSTIARIRNRAVWTGKRLDAFTGKTLFSKSKHNECLSAVNALLNPSIVRSNRDFVTIHDTGLVIEINGQASGTGGGTITEIQSADASVTITNPTGPIVDLSVAGGGLKVYTIDSHGTGADTDYVWATPIGGGTSVKILKPPLLRFSVSSNPSVSITYDTYDASSQSRFAHNAFSDVQQFITPLYANGQEIYVADIAGTLCDMNVDARTFAGP